MTDNQKLLKKLELINSNIKAILKILKSGQMADIEGEKTNGKKIKIDLDPWEWIIIGVFVTLIVYILQ